MKTIVFLLAFSGSLLAFVSMKTGEPCSQQATITKYDQGRCACCGGWIIMIESEKFLAPEIEGWNFEETMVFPMEVQIDYTRVNDPCNKIEVHCIRKAGETKG